MLRSAMIGCLAICLGAVAAVAAEPAGAVQVWNVEPWETVSAGDLGGTNPEMKALRPIALLAPRNGAASGFVVVTRDGAAIKGLKASVGALTQTGGKGSIAAAQAQVRFADLARPETSFMPAHRFDRLLETAPA